MYIRSSIYIVYGKCCAPHYKRRNHHQEHQDVDVDVHNIPTTLYNIRGLFVGYYFTPCYLYPCFLFVCSCFLFLVLTLIIVYVTHILHASSSCYTCFLLPSISFIISHSYILHPLPLSHIHTYMGIYSHSNFAYFSYWNETTSKSRVIVWVCPHCNIFLVVVLSLSSPFGPQKN